jgi:hypothetical protein
MLPVLRDIASGGDKMGKILATYDQNMGAVNRLNEERLKTGAGVIDQFESNIENLTVTAGAALGRIFTPVLNVGNKIVKVINDISETWVGGFGLRVGATAVVVGTIVAGFNTVRGIIRSVGYLQTIATASTEGMSAAAIKTNTQFAIMEAHMVRMVNLMRTMVQLQMMSSGTNQYSAGGWLTFQRHHSIVSAYRLVSNPDDIDLQTAIGRATDRSNEPVTATSASSGVRFDC